MKQSAGTLLYRRVGEQIEVLLVHASGAYNRKSPWSIPKGEPDPSEDDFEITARRETLEETGVVAQELLSLGHIVYTKSRKVVHCYGGPASPDAKPTTASWEVDAARFVLLSEARTLLHPEQVPFLDRLLAHLQSESEPAP